MPYTTPLVKMTDEVKSEGKRGRAESPKPGSGAPSSSEKNSSYDGSKAIDRLKARRLIISEEGLKRIAAHKYVPGVYTPIDNLMNKHLWTPLSEFIPKSIAPNTVTVTGLVIQIVGYSVVAYHCADFDAAAPSWVYIFAVFSIFAYQTLDALDGKQARRTGSSSPLGQLFDHGCDSVVTIFVAMLSAMTLHLGWSVRCVHFTMCMLLPFWMAQWTEYHAHVLPTSIAGFVGVTEAQLVSMFVTAMNVYDTGFWVRDLGIGTLPSWWCGRQSCPIAFNDMFVAAQALLAVMGIAHCTQKVIPAAMSRGTLGLAMLQTLPIYMLTLIGFAWSVMIPHMHPRLVLFTLGVSFSHMTCKMIVAAMSHTEYHLFQPILLPLPIIFAISKSQLLPRHDEVLLGIYTAVSTYDMAKWVKSAIEEISQYIGIHTFRLGRRATPKDK